MEVAAFMEFPTRGHKQCTNKQVSVISGSKYYEEEMLWR